MTFLLDSARPLQVKLEFYWTTVETGEDSFELSSLLLFCFVFSSLIRSHAPSAVNNGSDNSTITLRFARRVLARAQATRSNALLLLRQGYISSLSVKDELTAETVKNGFTFKAVESPLEVDLRMDPRNRWMISRLARRLQRTGVLSQCGG